MIRAYQHLLYGFYLWQTRVWRTGGAFNAILLTSIFIFVNTLTVVALLEALCARALLPPLSKTQIFIIYGFLIAAQYVPLFRLGYYQKIIERFSSEPPPGAPRSSVFHLGVRAVVVCCLSWRFSLPWLPASHRQGLTRRCSRPLAGLFPPRSMIKILPELASRDLASRG